MSLALVYQEAFKTVVRLQSGKLKGQTAAQVKASLINIFKTIDDDALKGRITYTPETLQDAKFALAAFADETALTSSDSVIKSQWNTPPNVSLILTLFKEANAGNEFYRRLERIRLGNPERTNVAQLGGSRELLEVYCLCLTLGYMGAQRGEQLKRTTDESVAEFSVRDRDLVVGKLALAEPAGSTPPRRLWLPVTLGVTLAAYVFFVLSLAVRASNLSALVNGNPL